MPSIAFFNNKGGVGKTTLACNMGAAFAAGGDRKVVVIDCDPQANATQLLLDDKTWAALYEDREEATQATVLKAFSAIRAGDSSVDVDVRLQHSERFGVSLLAGHPSLSTVEDRMSSSWGEFQAGLLGGARRSLWARTLTKSLDADVVIFDLGPSLGALNRSVLMGCDYFVTPVAADLFSLYALENIGDWMGGWLADYASSAARVHRDNPTGSSEFDVPMTLPIRNGYGGYTVQQYVTKRTGSDVRRVAAYDRYRSQIPDRAKALDALRTSDTEETELGVVPNMFSMVPLAQNAHAPIRDLRPADGVRGAQVTQQQRYVEQLDLIFNRLTQNLGLG